MKYAHPDVLDNGPAFIRNNAVRVLLIPAFAADMSYAQVLASALLSANVTPADFTLSDDGDGRKMVFGGTSAAASASMSAAATCQIAFVDATNRVLWVDDQTKVQLITAGLSYKLPKLTYSVPQPQPQQWW